MGDSVEYQRPRCPPLSPGSGRSLSPWERPALHGAAPPVPLQFLLVPPEVLRAQRMWQQGDSGPRALLLGRLAAKWACSEGPRLAGGDSQGHWGAGRGSSGDKTSHQGQGNLENLENCIKIIRLVPGGNESGTRAPVGFPNWCLLCLDW